MWKDVREMLLSKKTLNKWQRKKTWVGKIKYVKQNESWPELQDMLKSKPTSGQAGARIPSSA